MISTEVIKISIFASKVERLWPYVKDNHQDVINYFYRDFINLFTDKSVDDIILNFMYNPSIGIVGIIIFEEMANIFLEHKLITKNNSIALEISLYMISLDFHKKIKDSDLVMVLNPLLRTKNLSHCNEMLNVITSRKGWKNNGIIFDFYQKILKERRLIYNSYSILYIPKSNIFNNILSRLSLRFSNFKYNNFTCLLRHQMFNFINHLESSTVTLQYSEDLDSAILLYFLWLARQNKKIQSLNVGYIKNSSRKIAESFIVRLCSENQIPLRIRTIKEKVITKCKRIYFTQAKAEILLDLGYPIITAQYWNRNDFIQPLKVFTQAEKLYFVKKYKIPYYRLK